MKRELTNFKNVIKLVYTKKTKTFIKFLKGVNLFMQITENNSIFEFSSEETRRFRGIVLDVLSEACQMPPNEDEYEGIGTLAEKQMHAAIKRFICPDEGCHEVKIDGSELCIDKSDSDNDKKKKRRFVADILKGNTIYEIQTEDFAPLTNKIKWILENTTYNIVLIHPIAEIKWLNYISAKTGEIEKRQRSPLKGKFTDVANDLYFIRDFIGNPRFSLMLLMVEAEQYKKNTVKDARRRPKYRKYELIPVSLLSAYVFRSVEDYRLFIPSGLPDPFCVKNYSALSGIRGMDAYSIVKTLIHIGLLEESGNLGRAKAYRVKK